MARVPFRLPDIGEGIAEAEIVAWHVKIGDLVEEDQPVADMMTDKATVEMAAPVSGTVIELAGSVGDQVAIGSPLMVFETEEGAPSAHRDTVRLSEVEGHAAIEPPEARTSTSLSANGESGLGNGRRKSSPLPPCASARRISA